MKSFRIFLTGILLVLSSPSGAYTTSQPVPNIQATRVDAHAIYDPSTASYTCIYTITSGAANIGVIDDVAIDITTDSKFDSSLFNNTVPTATSGILGDLDARGVHILPVTMSAPAGWNSYPLSADGTASWGARGTASIGPGQTVNGFTLRAQSALGIRAISVSPEAYFYLNDPDEDSENPAIQAAQKAFFDSITYTTWTLGPLGPSGSVYGQWDQFRDTLNKAVQIGWIPDSTLANNLVTQLAQARTDFEAGHDTAAKNDLRGMLATLTASTDRQRRPEVTDLVNIYATAFINNLPNAPVAPLPYDPLIKVSPAAVTLPLNQTYTLTATLINVGNSDAPISGKNLSFAVTDGPDAGRRLSAITDSQGQAVFSFVGTKLGTDKITVSMAGTPGVRLESRTQVAANTDDIAPFLVAIAVIPPISAQAQVTWSGGPDLVVPLFSPPYIESQGGATIQIQDVTVNQGTTNAAASTTRYYLSASQPPFDVTQAMVIGERPVPALAAGAKSDSGLQPFVLPSSIPAGQYFMAACANANNAVAELEETNNCSWSRLKTGNAIVVPVKQINPPPDCSQAAAAPALLWPPNHKLVTISITGVSDPDGEPVTIQVTKITQDEPVNGLGDGDTSPDGFGIGQPQAQVRAERSGLGNGRVYAITFTASDPVGGTCTGTVNVGVPHDQGKGSTPIDDGQRYDSTLP